jgi:hypothetical protein
MPMRMAANRESGSKLTVAPLRFWVLAAWAMLDGNV